MSKAKTRTTFKCEECGRADTPSNSSHRHPDGHRICTPCWKRIVWRPRGGDAVERAREWSRAYKDRNRDAVRAANRAYHHRPENRGLCAECGELRGVGAKKHHDEGRCTNCRHKQSERRADRIVEMYNAGATLKVIAADIGTTPGAVGVACDSLRKAGRIGYRYAGWAERVAA